MSLLTGTLSSSTKYGRGMDPLQLGELLLASRAEKERQAAGPLNANSAIK